MCCVYYFWHAMQPNTDRKRERERKRDRQTDRLVQYTSFPPLSSHPSNLATFPLNFQNLHLLDP